MKIYSALQIGDYHTDHCEDYLFIEEAGDQLICAVMDGCTMGTDSYFAATLTGKLLKKIIKVKAYQEFYQPGKIKHKPEAYLKSVLQQLFEELNVIKAQLLLEQNELLTTLMLLVIDKQAGQGIVFVVGDGVVNINGHITVFDQDNKPDYIGFHLHERFEDWYGAQTQKIVFDTIEDISIASDGIELFARVDNITDTGVDPLHFLMTDTTGADHEDMLYRKLKQLEHLHGMRPGDDLALVRIIA